MKRISLIINIVLGAAVIALYILHFMEKKEQPTLEDLLNVTTQIVPDSASIAYINYDSLILSYDFYHELSEKYQSIKQSKENDFLKRQKDFEKQYVDFNEKVSKRLVTQYQAKEMEEKLLAEQQNLIALRDQLTAQLLEEEQVMQNQLHYSIAEFLKEYNQTKGYQYILSYTFGGPILYTSESFNITQDVIKGINNRYVKKDTEK